VTELAQHLVDGVTLGAVYVLVALSITVIFGLTGIVNFAVGALMTISAYLVFAVTSHGGSLVGGILVAVVAMAVFGGVLERVTFRWTLSEPHNGFIVSLGLILILQAGAIVVWGTDTHSVSSDFTSQYKVGGVIVGQSNLVVLVAALVAASLFLLWLTRSKSGRALRGASENREAAQLMGIPVTRLTTIVFVIASALIGLSGSLVTTYSTIYPLMGTSFLLISFVIAIVGGLGSIKGTLVAGVGVAILQSLAMGYLPIQWTDAFVFAAVVVVMLLRPDGLFGVRHG
jgi:branched-chain amino acid transport system permease protein